VSRTSWPAADTYVAALTPEARRTLLDILTSTAEVRAAAIGRLSIRDDGADLAELLIELEEKEWARQWFVERCTCNLDRPQLGGVSV
jgi:hypothetical protein